MIYLQNITDAQAVFVPKSLPASDDPHLEFVARNTIDLDIKVDVEAIDLDISSLYFEIAVTLPAGMPIGEYEYTLTDNGMILSTGILIVGNLQRPSQTEIPIEYEQYISD